MVNKTVKHLLGRNFVRWFNLSAVICIEFRKSAIAAIHIKPIIHNQMMQIRLRYICLLKIQLWSHLHVYKKNLNLHSLLKSKRTDELTGKF